MSIQRILSRAVAGLAAAALLAGCHFAGHMPPGQAKKLTAPPPGYLAVPPGHRK